MSSFSSSAREHGSMLPASVLRRSDISPGCKLVLGLLRELAGSTGHCWPSQRYLAEALGMSRKSIQNHLEALFRAKLLHIQRGRTGGVLRYYPIQEASSSAAAAVRPGSGPGSGTGSGRCVKVTQGCVKFTPNRNKRNKNTDPPSPPRGGRRGSASLVTPEEKGGDFSRLWAAWPVHQGEKEAKRVFLRLARANALPGVDALIRTVAEFQERDSRWSRGKVKLLSNWLRGHCWNDEPFAEPSGPGRSGTTPAPLPVPEISPALRARVQEVAEACARKEPSPPLPEPSALAELLTLWPDRPGERASAMIRAAWRHTVTVRGLKGTGITQAARAYLASVDEPLRLEQWLRLECQVEPDTA